MLQISHLSADYGGKPALADINLTLDRVNCWWSSGLPAAVKPRC
jgi:taurine transport system ATP-binding protein